MPDLNNISSADLSSTRQVSDSKQVTATQRAAQPPYDVASGASANDVALRGSAPSLPSPDQIDAGQAKSGLDVISQNVSFDFYEIAAVMVRLNEQAAKASRDAAVGDILSVADQMNKSADDIRAGASLALAGGIVSGAGQIVSGGISIAGGMQSFKIASQAAPAPEEVPVSEESEAELTARPTDEAATQTPLSETPVEDAPVEGEPTEATQQSTEETTEELTEELTASKKSQLDKAGLDNIKEQNATFIISQKANSISLKTQGYSQAVSGASQLAASGFKYGSDQFQAKSKQDEAHAEKTRATLERERQYSDSLRKSSQDMQQTLRDMQQAQHQTTSQIMQSRV